MKKLLLSLFSTLIVLAIVLIGYTQELSAEPIEPITLSYSAPGPAGLFQSKLMQRMLDDITAASDGKITIKT